MGDGQPESAAARKARLLMISFAAMMIVGVGNRVFSVLSLIPMNNYPLFMNQLTTFAYIPTSLLWVVPLYLRGGRTALEAKPIPQKAWIVMGFLDSVAGVLQTLSIAKISNGSLVVLLLQSAIPFSMAITYYFLKARYTPLQYFGALVVVAGLVVVLAPTLGGGGDGSNTAIWSFVLMLSCVPMTLSSVYKELTLGDIEIDPIHFNLAVAVYQFLWSWPLLVPMAYASGLTVTDIGANLWGGMKCFAGSDSIFGGSNPDNCTMGPIYTMAYIAFNLGYNVLIILILKYGSSNLLWLSLVAAVPIQDLAFGIPGIPGYQAITPFIGAGLPIILSGLVFYRFHAKVKTMLQGWGVYPKDKPGAQGGAAAVEEGEDAGAPLLSGAGATAEAAELELEGVGKGGADAFKSPSINMLPSLTSINHPVNVPSLSV